VPKISAKGSGPRGRKKDESGKYKNWGWKDPAWPGDEDTVGSLTKQSTTRPTDASWSKLLLGWDKETLTKKGKGS